MAADCLKIPPVDSQTLGNGGSDTMLKVDEEERKRKKTAQRREEEEEREREKENSYSIRALP
ncbi:hypothetical protein QML37_30695 [Klebsiella pneumoniae]|uniref:hypothetical protein n=1 Tax=Klebsiella pneumoniae TaxID=573 RepID=UPI003A7F68CF